MGESSPEQGQIIRSAVGMDLTSDELGDLAGAEFKRWTGARRRILRRRTSMYMPRAALACLVFVLLTLTGCPICEDCLADGSSGTDTSGDGDGDGDGDPAVCGDGIVQPGEECDDGNTNELDTCTTLCVTSVELELSFSAIKQFDFSWAAAPGA